MVYQVGPAVIRGVFGAGSGFGVGGGAVGRAAGGEGGVSACFS